MEHPFDRFREGDEILHPQYGPAVIEAVGICSVVIKSFYSKHSTTIPLIEMFDFEPYDPSDPINGEDLWHKFKRSDPQLFEKTKQKMINFVGEVALESFKKNEFKIEISDYHLVIKTPIGGYLVINKELVLGQDQDESKAKYFIYYAHPEKGSTNFFIQKNADGIWASNNAPFFVTNRFIEWVGQVIEEKNHPTPDSEF